MRVPFLILICYISFVITDQQNYVAKSYPKKFKPYGQGKILIKSGKYVVNTKTHKANEPLKTISDKYTAFQALSKLKVSANIPDSPYFPIDQVIDSKPRVKKILPNPVWPMHSRQKRSAGNKKNTPAPHKWPGNPRPTKTDAHQIFRQKPTSTKDQRSAKTSKKAQIKITKKSATRNTKGKNRKIDQKNSHGRLRVKKSKRARSKTRSKRKLPGKNGTALKKRLAGQKKGGKGVHKNLRQEKRKLPRPFKKLQLKHNIPVKKILPETRRLTSAREAMIEDYPYVVSIQKDEQHWCSGALLNPRLVITTANCLWKSKRLSRMEVRVGSSYTDRGGQVAGIQEVMKHPKWGLRKNPDNDVALILLDTKIRFSHSVHGVDLPNHAMIPAFEDAWVTSWGAERRDGIFNRYETTLQVYHTMLMSHALCNNITTRFGVVVTENFICLSQTGKSAPCTRDTGAPAVSDGVLWGLASWGIRKLCGTERFPSMFSYIASHNNMDFIANATSYLMAEERLHPYLDRPPPFRLAKKANMLNVDLAAQMARQRV